MTPPRSHASGVHRSRPHGLQQCSELLHVLLRHRLLPQPGGFEGIGAVQERPCPDDLFVPIAHDGVHGHLNRDAVFRLHFSSPACRPRRLLSSCSSVIFLLARTGNPPSPPSLLQLGEPRPRPSMAAKRRPAVRSPPARSRELHVLVVEGDPCLVVASVEQRRRSPPGSALQRGVLLRHLPRSISR